MLTIQPISAFDDNDIWLVFDQQSRQAFAMDPGDAANGRMAGPGRA